MARTFSVKIWPSEFRVLPLFRTRFLPPDCSWTREQTHICFLTRDRSFAERVFHSDYAVNEALDRYSDIDINDEEEFAGMTAAQRRAAEAQMSRRDRMERRGGRGGRASRRTRFPGFLESDDMEDEDAADGGLLSQMKRRTRRQYDERRDMDDLDGIEDVSLGS